MYYAFKIPYVLKIMFEMYKTVKCAKNPKTPKYAKYNFVYRVAKSRNAFWYPFIFSINQ